MAGLVGRLGHDPIGLEALAEQNRPENEIIGRSVKVHEQTEQAAGPVTASVDGEADVVLIGVRKTYGDVVAVDSVDLEIAKGEFFTMLGPSGSGKTTTLRIIAGFERPDTGRVVLGGDDVTGRPPYDRNVNTVFQDYALFPHMSVSENVEYGLRVKGVKRQERKVRAQEALALVQLEGFGGRKPVQLSGGQRQRVALARAIVNHPQVLLLDEPLGALDLKLRQEMQSELKRIQKEIGITFVYDTHDQEEALTMSDRIAVFSQGKIDQIGTPADIYEHPANEFVAAFVGISNLLERDGRRFTIRPEKIRLLLDGEQPESGDHAERGTVREVVYAGMITRYVVDLDQGGEIVVVRQNTTGPLPAGDEGKPATVTWDPGATFAIQDGRKEEG